MRSVSVLLATPGSVTVLTAVAADTIDVPSAQVLKVAIKSSTPRDTWARQDATAFFLSGVVRVQAGERAQAEKAKQDQKQKL